MFQLFRRYNIPRGARYFKIKMNPDPNLPEVRLWGVKKWRDLRIKEMEYNGVTILKAKGKTIRGYFIPHEVQSRSQHTKDDAARSITSSNVSSQSLRNLKH